jgi:hypothetical protein
VKISSRQSLEISLELTAQELLRPPTPAHLVEVDDIGEVDPLLRTGSLIAQPAVSAEAAPAAECEGTVEIELTAEQIVALLEQP